MGSAHAWDIVLSHEEAMAELKRQYVELYAEDAYEAAAQILDRDLTSYEQSAVRSTAHIDWKLRILHFIVPAPELREEDWNELPTISVVVSFLLRP